MGFLFAMTLPGLVIALILVVALDRILLRVRGKGINGGTSTSAGVSRVGFDQVASCFYAGKQVEIVEREGQQQRRPIDGDGAAK